MSIRPDIPLGHTTPAHQTFGWCSYCPDRSPAEELAAWQTRELRRMADETATTETLAAALSPAERTMLDYALNQAQLRMWSVGGYTAEEQAALVSLRRLTADEPAAGARQDGAQS